MKDVSRSKKRGMIGSSHHSSTFDTKGGYEDEVTRAVAVNLVRDVDAAAHRVTGFASGHTSILRRMPRSGKPDAPARHDAWVGMCRPAERKESDSTSEQETSLLLDETSTRGMVLRGRLPNPPEGLKGLLDDLS